MKSTHGLLAALIVAVGVALSGWFIGEGFLGGRSADRYVTVKASQGLFQILPRDRAPGVSQEGQLYKTVRVVSTVQYYLEN